MFLKTGVLLTVDTAINPKSFLFCFKPGRLVKATASKGLYSQMLFFGGSLTILKFRRVTIRGAQPSARLSEEICLSEGSAGVSPRALRGLSEGSAGSLRGLCGVSGGSAGFSEVFGGSDPMLVTLRNADNSGREFWREIFGWAGTLEKQGRKIRYQNSPSNSLRNSLAIFLNFAGPK